MAESTLRISASTLVRSLGVDAAAGNGPAYRRLAYRIRSAVLDGRLAVTTGLPSERELAVRLSMSRTRWPAPTPCSGTRAGWIPGAGRAVGCGFPTSRRVDREVTTAVARPASSATRGWATTLSICA